MPDPYDVVIAGAGLAGATSAFFLSRSHRVLVLEADSPASGASGIAPGIANPLMSLWARPVWRMEEALSALEELIADVSGEEFVRREGVLRPARDESQAKAFEEVPHQFPRHATWLSADRARERHPVVSAPFGALWNSTAMVVQTDRLVGRLLERAREQNAELWSSAVLMRWENDGDALRIRVHRPQGAVSVRAQRIILCVGREYVDFPALARLRLHGVKGQLVRVSRPSPLSDVPHLAGRGYVLVEKDALILGGTYQHQFCDLHPDPDHTRTILQTTAEMIPGLAEADVLEERTGVRVTVPGIRLPMLGPLPDEPRVWVFTGLGSKGLLMAPLLGRALPEYLNKPSSIPRDVAVRAS